MNDFYSGLLLITGLTLFMKNGFHSCLQMLVCLCRIKIKLEKEFSVDSAIFSLNITNKIGNEIPTGISKTYFDRNFGLMSQQANTRVVFMSMSRYTVTPALLHH